MQIKEPFKYVWKERMFVAALITMLFLLCLLSIIAYRQWFINSYYQDKPAVAREMAGEEEDKKLYKPEDVKMVPVMTRNFSTDMDKDIVKVLNKKCDTIELKLMIKTVDPLLMDHSDVSIEVENTDPDKKGCSLIITAADKVK